MQLRLELLYLSEGQLRCDRCGHATNCTGMPCNDDLIADAGLALRKLGKVFLGMGADLRITKRGQPSNELGHGRQDRKERRKRSLTCAEVRVLICAATFFHSRP